MSTKTTTAFASATQPSTAEELMGKLAAYRPVGTREFETKVGTSVATIAQVVLIGPEGQAEDLGERPVFWVVVRRQLATATPEVPWVIGRLEQSGQAYRLQAMAESDATAVRKAISSLQ